MFKPKTPKLLVEIIHETRRITKKKCSIDGKTVLIEPKRGRRKTGWCPSYESDGIFEEQYGWGPFKRWRKKLLVRENAEECASLSKKGKLDIPSWDKEAIRRFISAEIASRLGDVKIKHELPLVFWVIAGGTFLNLILLWMTLSGVRLG